ncbi:MAG: hypothetical protein ACR2P5_03230 [Gammaproteobacteria bacterium]
MALSEFLVRALAGFVVFVILVLLWAFLPYFQGAHLIPPEVELDAGVVSIFLGTVKARGWTVVLLLLSRGCFGMSLVSWLTLPGLQFFADAEFQPLARAGFIFFFGLSTIFFFAALGVHALYYSGA